MPPKFVKLSATQASKIASDLCLQIDASQSSKENVAERWRRVAEMYQCDPKGSNLQVVDGLAPYTFPLYRQKANAIGRSITKAYFGIKPWVQMIDVSRQEDDTDAQVQQMAPQQGQPVDDVERTFQAFLERSNLKNVIGPVMLDAVNYNVGIIQPQLDANGDLDARHVPPQESVLFPCQKSDYRKMITLGHRIDINRFEVEEGLEDGTYNKAWLIMGKVGMAPQEDINPDIVQARDLPVDDKRGDEQVECYELCTKLRLDGDKKRVWYKAVVEKQGRQLMSLEMLPYSRPWYFVFKTNFSERNMYPSDSIGGVCQGLQFAYNDAGTIMLHGSYMTAFPPVLVTGGSLGNKVATYQPGQVIESADDMKMHSIPITFNPAALPAMMEKLEQLMDGITGISQLGEGQNLPANTTATAASGFLQGQQEAKDFYVEVMSSTYLDMFTFLFELMLTHGPLVKARLGSEWQINDDANLDVTAINLQPTGSGATTDPQLMSQKLGALYQMSQNPISSYDPEKVEDLMVETMDIPTDTTKLKKPPPDPNAPPPPTVELKGSISFKYEDLALPPTPLQQDALEHVGLLTPPPINSSPPEQSGMIPLDANAIGMGAMVQGQSGMEGAMPIPPIAEG